jgi:hypothetical protein
VFPTGEKNEKVLLSGFSTHGYKSLVIDRIDTK